MQFCYWLGASGGFKVLNLKSGKDFLCCKIFDSLEIYVCFFGKGDSIFIAKSYDGLQVKLPFITSSTLVIFRSLGLHLACSLYQEPGCCKFCLT